MSQSYSDYEQDYNQTLSRVRSFLSSNARSTTTLRECERLLTHARNCAATMVSLAEAEGDTLRIADANVRVERDITPLLEEVHRSMKEKDGVNVNIERSRKELFGGAYQAPRLESTSSEDNNDDTGVELGLGSGGGGGNTEMLIQESEKLLLNSQSLCAESEQIGSETINTMGMQREQLYRTHDRLRGANEYIEQAGIILRDMHRKVFRNKLFLYSVIALLIVANVIVILSIIVRAFKGKGKSHDDNGNDGSESESDDYYSVGGYRLSI